MRLTEIASRYRQEFARQAQTLVANGYTEAAGLTPSDFRALIAPLEDQVEGLAVENRGLASDPDPDVATGRIPFIIVVKRDLVDTATALAAIEHKGARGHVNMDPVAPEDFPEIDGVDLPADPVYLIAEVDTGRSTLNVTPDDALPILAGAGRSPLTIDEGVALLTHHPAILRERNCFSLLASRRGDRRVPALWISRGRPRLGWCWAGNPHTWLGSASCAARLGAGVRAKEILD